MSIKIKKHALFSVLALAVLPLSAAVNDTFEKRNFLEGTGYPQSDSANVDEAKVVNNVKYLYWEWSATASGTVTLSTNGTGYEHAMYVGLLESDDTYNTLHPYPRTWGNITWSTSQRLDFSVTTGTRILILIVSRYSDATGDAHVTLFLDDNNNFAQLPFVHPLTYSNDDFANRIDINAAAEAHADINPSFVSVAASLQAATYEVFGEVEKPGVWWQYTAPSNGVLRISTNTSDSDFDKQLDVAIGDRLGQLDWLAGLGGASYPTYDYPSIVLPVVAEQTYIIRLGNNKDQADSGTVVLTLNLDTEGTVMESLNFVGPVIGSNRTFNQREPISGSNFSILAYNTMADNGLETGEIGRYRTLWWEWTVPADGLYTLSIEGSFRRYSATEGFNKSLSVFQGTSLGNLQRVAAVGHQHPPTTNPTINLEAIEGEKLLIQVGSYNSNESGPLILRIVGPESDELPVITSWPQANGQVGRAFTYQIEADNEPTEFAVHGLPQGLSLNSSNGAITGVPAYPGEFLVSLRAKKGSWEDARILRLKVAPRERMIPDAATPFMDGWMYSVQTHHWYYTTAEYYPLIWDGERQEWLHYVEETSAPRVFFNLSQGNRMEHQPSP